MHLLLKPLYHLLEPLTLVVAGLAILTVLLFRRQQKRLAIFSGCLWLVLALTTCTAFGEILLRQIEKEWADMHTKWDSIPNCDVVMVLGGGIAPNATEMIGVDMQENSDRITTAIELIRRGKAGFLMLGGGSGEDQNGSKISESKAVRHWIENWKLVTVPMADLGICTNTREEALMFGVRARENGWKKVILVTSASHMRRALAVFRKTTGLEIVPVACAFHTGVAITKHPTEWVHFPDPGALERLGIWVYETVGWWLYSARGWV